MMNVAEPGAVTMRDIYGNIGKNQLESISTQEDMPTSMKYALRDAHFFPHMTMEEFRQKIREYTQLGAPREENARHEQPPWVARVLSLPPDAKPHEVYAELPEYELSGMGW